ncbi:MAG: GYD domain-containing protein [Myxococcota bacterium]|jgi:uncharacterized protein with GYD domain|nr:GYD domain-containing protein [Myxococcota bacterium]
MPFFIRLLRLTDQGMQMLRDQQTAFQEMGEVIQKGGGKLVAAWVTQGEYDIISVIDAPDDKAMRQISGKVAVKGYYTGKTLPAIPVNEFIRTFGQSAQSSMFVESWFRASRQQRGGR